MMFDGGKWSQRSVFGLLTLATIGVNRVYRFIDRQEQ